MKTENNLQNKATFFAQYYLQEVFIIGTQTFAFDGLNMNEIDDGDCLLLRPLSSITDDEAIEVAYTNWPDYRERKAAISKEWLLRVLETISQNRAVYQFLQSKSFALPWRDLSVDDLIEYGWIKLKEI